MPSDSPLGVSGDTSRGEGSSPRAAASKSFWGEQREIPPAHDWKGSKPVPVRTYWTGEETFMLGFGNPGAHVTIDIWTTEAGLEAVIAACQEALDAARVAREATT